MAPKLLSMLLFLAVISARTVDIHIVEDKALSSVFVDDPPKCELHLSGDCKAECPSDQKECHASQCGGGGCCVEGYREKLCCENKCPEGSKEKEQHKIASVPKPVPKLVEPSCHWEGTAPSCVTGCAKGRLCGVDACGGGACCWTGWKSWCCEGGCPNVMSLTKLGQTPMEL